LNPVQPTLDYLYGLQKFGMKLGLHNILELLRSSGNPHEQFSSVHIAGTNGKGSTSSMIAAVLTAAGYKVGLYTSPHLVRFNERIRINGAMISDHDLVRYAKMFRSKIDTLNATFFEATTAIAFKCFADAEIDIGIIETGLGGRLDATNVLVPEVSVITSIGKDHTEHLGNSLRKIAFEKGGIIKRGVVCVSGVKSRIALQELKKISKQRSSSLIDVNRVASVKSLVEKGETQICAINTRRSSYPNLRLPLLGDFQAHNARVAIVALEQLSAKGFTISPLSIRKGFRELRRLTGIRGRFESLHSDPMIILDVGHNPDGISAVVAELQRHRYRRLLLVFGVMKDKNYETMIRFLSTLNPVVFAVRPETDRALLPEAIAETFQRRNCVAQAYHPLANGVRLAMRIQGKNDLLLVCGSHYVAGEALPVIEKELRRKSS
jgi:dihydrofolate synthase/folylpolyglutamate synthase